TEQSALLERSEAIHRTLTRAALELDSLDAILHRIAVALGRPCGFFDATGQRMAFHHPSGPAPAGGPSVAEAAPACPPPAVIPAEVGNLLQEADSPLQVWVNGRPWLVGPV